MGRDAINSTSPGRVAEWGLPPEEKEEEKNDAEFFEETVWEKKRSGSTGTCVDGKPLVCRSRACPLPLRQLRPLPPRLLPVRIRP